MSQETAWLKHLASHIGLSPIAESLETDEGTVRGLGLGQVEFSDEMLAGFDSLKSVSEDMFPLGGTDGDTRRQQETPTEKPSDDDPETQRGGGGPQEIRRPDRALAKGNGLAEGPAHRSGVPSPQPTRSVRRQVRSRRGQLTRRQAFQWVLRQTFGEVLGRIGAPRGLDECPVALRLVCERQLIFETYPFLRPVGALWPAYSACSRELLEKKTIRLRRIAMRKLLLIIEFASLKIVGGPDHDLKECIAEWEALQADFQEVAGFRAKSGFNWMIDKKLRDPYVLLCCYTGDSPKVRAEGSWALFVGAHEALQRESHRRRIEDSTSEPPLLEARQQR